MKLAITTTGGTWTSAMDPRFGRAAHIAVVDTAENTLTVHDNTVNLQAAQGAGIQTAQTVARLGVEALITGHVGPKAFRALAAAGIPIYLCEGVDVAEALRRFRAGELPATSAATVEGHWA